MTSEQTRPIIGSCKCNCNKPFPGAFGNNTRMPQLTTNLRLLISTADHNTAFLRIPSSLSLLFYKPYKFPQTHKSFSFFASSNYKNYKNQRYRSKPPFRSPIHRRNNSSQTEESEKKKKKKREGSSAMEDGNNESVGFNKRRAEGRDKKDRPKTLQLKVRKLNPINTVSYVQVLGTGMDTQDTSPSVLLFFDKQRFIFNAGEGLQRYCTEHKIKLSKIDHIFLSRVCSETAGGLPGLLLTLAGMGDQGMSVNLWGPSDFKYLVDAMKSFIPNAAMVHTRSFGSVPGSDGVAMHDKRKLDDPIVLIEDEVVKISAILLHPTCSDGAELALKPGDLAVIYVCELPEVKGKFDPKKAVALGLRPGPKYRELQLGNSVKSDHQDIMVHPSDVLGPSVPGPIVLLVDCPTPSHMQQLLSTQSLNSYYADNPTESSRTVNCVIHLSPTSVVDTNDYKTWMSRFVKAQHIMAGHELKNIEIPILKASARIAARLNYICPQVFPAPGFWSLKNLSCSAASEFKASSDESSISKLCESISAENLLKFNLRPLAQMGLDRQGIPAMLSPLEIIDELLLEIPEAVEAAQQVAQFWCDEKKMQSSIQNNKLMIEEPWLNGDGTPPCLENVTREEMEIVLLGTGSAQPSKYRNVSAVFINLFAKGSLLLDCGEGTLGQLKRRFGIEGADDAVRGLRCIWISHIHADHHTGLARILALRRDLLKGIPHEPVIVMGPVQLKRYLDAYERLENLDMQFLDCRHTTEASLNASLELNQDESSLKSNQDGSADTKMDQSVDSTLFAKGSRMESFWKRRRSPVNSSIAFTLVKKLEKVLGEAGLESLISFPVVHCPYAYGVALRAANRVDHAGRSIPGWKIVYSGDTRPCPELITASHGATVLIHEATFEDGMMDEALARNHSTTNEAIEVGDKAGAYRIILTHFSQRYPKIPVFDESHMHKTCVAFDMMSVNLADLPVLPKVLPYLKLLFKNEMPVEEVDEQADDDDANVAVADV